MSDEGVVYKSYVGYGRVEKPDDRRSEVDTSRKPIENKLSLKELEDIAWM